MQWNAAINTTCTYKRTFSFPRACIYTLSFKNFYKQNNRFGYGVKFISFYQENAEVKGETKSFIQNKFSAYWR